jgi:adenosine kinase
MDIGVTGSVAFDHIMSFGGRFKEHILPDKIHSLNVSFLVDGFEKRRGGCAANIAYACALHGVDVGLIAAVGHDFESYGAWLASSGVDLGALHIDADRHTASCFITTDRDNNQIAGFYPGAMAAAAELSLEQPTVGRPRAVIISPNDPAAMVRYPSECRRLGIPFFYDPGQQVIALDGPQLADGLDGATGLFCNDYELATIEKKLEVGVEGLLERCERVIVTLGSEGSRIHSRDGSVIEIPVAPVEAALDPTGCGDAYRGGYLAGWLQDRPLEECGRLGALTASYCVEVQGTSEYHFTRAAFAERYQRAFDARTTVIA